jgi:hypothetical protein
MKVIRKTKPIAPSPKLGKLMELLDQAKTVAARKEPAPPSNGNGGADTKSQDKPSSNHPVSTTVNLVPSPMPRPQLLPFGEARPHSDARPSTLMGVRLGDILIMHVDGLLSKEEETWLNKKRWNKPYLYW